MWRVLRPSSPPPPLTHGSMIPRRDNGQKDRKCWCAGKSSSPGLSWPAQSVRRRGAAAPAAPFPPHLSGLLFGINRKGNHRSHLSRPESAMVADPAMTEKASQHGKRGQREHLIDKGLLAIQSFGRAAAGFGIFLFVQHLRIKLGHGSQALRSPPVTSVQGLPQNVLPVRSAVADVEPVLHVSGLPADGLVNGAPSCAGIDATDNQVRAVSILIPKARERFRQRAPAEPPEKVDAGSEHDRFVEPDVARRERLTHTIGLCHHIAVENGDVKAKRVAPGQQCLMEIWKVEEKRASRSSGSDHQHLHGATEEISSDVVLNLHGAFPR